MEISTDSKGTIVFKGNLLVTDIETIYSEIESLLEDSSRDITLDLRQVDEIDIAGLQLLYSLKRTFESDGALHILAINQSIRDIIDLSGFNVPLKEALP
jgi:anti-anti-sigma factor